MTTPVTAVITLPPRGRERWPTILQLQLRRYAEQLSALEQRSKQLKTPPDGNDQWLDLLLTSGCPLNVHFDDVLDLVKRAKAETMRRADRLIDSKLGLRHELEQFMSTWRDDGFPHSRLTRLTSVLHDFNDDDELERMLEYERRYGADLTLEDAHAVRGYITEALGVVSDVLRFVKESLKRIAAERQEHFGADKPPAEDVETLYHASAWAADIARDGWRRGDPTDRVADRVGLGGPWTNGLISFTYDLHYAQAVSRTMKDLVMIANQQVRVKDVLSWLRDDGVGDLDAAARNIGEGRRPNDTDDTPLNTYIWYRRWQRNSMFHSLRVHPLVIDNALKIVDVLRGRHVRDVGVLACQVEVGRDDVEFKSGEREYRVPVDAILETKRLW